MDLPDLAKVVAASLSLMDPWRRESTPVPGPPSDALVRYILVSPSFRRDVYSTRLALQLDEEGNPYQA